MTVASPSRAASAPGGRDVRADAPSLSAPPLAAHASAAPTAYGNLLARLSPAELEQRLADWGYRPSHAERLLRAYYRQGGELELADQGLPSGLAQRLSGPHVEPVATRAATQRSSDGTAKLLLRLGDGRTVESVLIPDHRGERAAGCLSSQVGCAMGCDFCATAKGGWERDLVPEEIVAQFLALRREAALAGRRLQTVVFMGMGEPMLNLEAVIEAIRRMADNRCGGLGWRQVTVSTVGIVPGIDALAATGLGVHLAVSLHAPDDATRSRLLPTGRRYSIADILAAADRFQAVRGRPVTIQYCLLDGVNDTVEQAQALASLLGGRRMHVNLLSWNPTGTGLRGAAYQRSSVEASQAFVEVLRARGVVAHFRASRGPDIEAACGQLRERVGAGA